MKKKRSDKILEEIHQVLKKLGLPCCQEHMQGKMFGMGVIFRNLDDFKVSIGIIIDDENGHITLSMSPPDKIPEEKIPVVMNVINRINNTSIAEHIWMDCETNDVIVMKGIFLVGKTLDKEEFEATVNGLLSSGVVTLKTVLEQAASDEKPEVLVKRMLEKYSCHT